MGSTTINETNAVEQQMMELRRVIRTSRERVFEAWATPEGLRQWFGRTAGHIEAVEMDVREGGRYYIRMSGVSGNGPDQADLPPAEVSGEYTEVVPHERLRFTWRPQWNPGEESLVTVELLDVADGTEMILTHERFTSMESRNGHAQGWTAALNKLEKCLRQ